MDINLCLALADHGIDPANPDHKTYHPIDNDFYLSNVYILHEVVYPTLKRLLELSNLPGQDDPYRILWFQSEDLLREFIRTLPSVKGEIKWKRGRPPPIVVPDDFQLDPNAMSWKQLVWYITNVAQPTKQTIINFFSTRHLDYPDRDRLVRKYAESMRRHKSLSYMDFTDADEILCLPPVRLEEDVVRGRLVPETSLVALSNRQKRPQLTWEDLLVMIQNRDCELDTLEPEDFYRVTGLEFDWESYYIVTPYLWEPEWWLRTAWPLGYAIPESDILGDPLVLPCLAFGTLNSLKNYNVSELLEAWRHGNYIHPDEPNESWSNDQMYGLKELINMYPLQVLRPLTILLRQTSELTLADILPELDTPDIAVKLFISLFLTGMVQRRWLPDPNDSVLDLGPINPYPHKTVETQGGSLEDLEVSLTPYLNCLNDILKTSGAMLGRLSTRSLDSPGSQTIQQLVNEVREGKYCIAIASAVLIETGYWYLGEMKVEIPGFDWDKFESRSTQR